MRYNHTILNVVACALGALPTVILTSCAKEDWDWLVGTPINVVAVQETTRSASDIQTGSFEAGTEINAYYRVHNDTEEGESLGNSPTTLTASAPDANGKNVLTPDVQPYYPQSGTVDIYALYPIDESVLTNNSTSFTVQANQSSDANYKLSDLMWAGVTGQSKTQADVALTFSHLMSKIVIDVTAKEGVKIESVKLTNTKLTVPLNNLKKSTRSLGEASATGTITIGSDAAGTTHIGGAALFPPQTIQANFIEVVTKDYGTATYSVDKTFESGKQYIVNLTVTRQQIGCTTTITDWNSDGGNIAVPPGSSAGLKIEHIPDTMYTEGKAIEPELHITYTPNSEDGETGDTYTLTADDYDVEYFNNTNVGAASVIIKGKKNDKIDSQLASSISQIKAITSFNITTATGSIDYEDENKTIDYVYYGTVENTLNKHGGDGNFTYKSSKENVATVAPTGVVTIKGVGTTVITANMDNQGNYTAATASYTLTVNPRKISTAETAGEIVVTPSVTSVPYNGLPYQPSVTVTDKGRTLQKGVHYTTEYANNTNKGTATITIKGMGVYDATDTYKTTTTFTITQVAAGLEMDNTDVTLPDGFSITRKATTKFGTITYSSDKPEIATVTDGVVTAVSTGTAKITAQVTTDSPGNYPTTSISFNVIVIASEWIYDYNGKVQSWTCPITGVYKLAAYGAQGGSSALSAGGHGAYVAGQLKLTANQVIYMYVGQQGLDITTASATQGGWNGGGQYSGTNATGTNQTHYCGGGGATDFSLQGTAESTSWDNEAHWKSRILVAGGGGGALYRIVSTNYQFIGGGGGGGAYEGETGYGGAKPGGGGTLNAAGTIAASGTYAVAASFGKGGNYNGTYSAGLGGGGWYGGASGATDGSVTEDSSTNTYSRQGSGGGGSSYIWSSANKSYYSGHGTNNAPEVPSGSVMSQPTDFYLTPAGMTVGARSGHGRAVITYMGEEE